MGGTMSKGEDDSSESSQKVNSITQDDTSAESSSGAERQDLLNKHAKTQRNLKKLTPDMFRIIGSYLSLQEMKKAEIELSKPLGRARFFQSRIDELNALNAVMTGDPELLIAAARTNPDLLFLTADKIIDPARQVFYTASPYHMMLFLCDDDMLNQVMRTLSPMPEKLGKKMKLIQAEFQQGGADLVRLNRDPRNLNFEDILRFRTTCRLPDETIKAVAFPLLENPDGVLYYKDAQNNDYWFYANQATRTIEPIILYPELMLEQEEAYASLVIKMKAMEPMSARRSSNDEHQFIANSMCYLANRETNAMEPVTLVREGITYKQDGIVYCDTRYDFNRYTNAYRKCIRLYVQGASKDGEMVWKRELGHAQKEVIWLLQRYCDKELTFDPLPARYKTEPFFRGFQFENWVGQSGRIDNIYDTDTGVLHEGLESTFGLCKKISEYDNASTPSQEEVWPAIGREGGWRLGADLVAVTRLIEDAKSNIVELLNSDLTKLGPRQR